MGRAGFNNPIEPMDLANIARQRCAVAPDLVPQLPPRKDHERRPPARQCDRAIARPADVVRSHGRYEPELASYSDQR